MHKPRLSTLIILIPVAMLAAGISACSSSGSKSPARDDGFGQAEIDGRAQADPSGRGLELRLMTVDDTGNRVAQALARFDRLNESGVLSDEDRLRWRSWGLRWIVVPVDQLDGVLGSQLSTHATQIRSMGEFPQWRPLIRTGEIRSRSVRVGSSAGGRLEPIAGRPRLMARVWSTPVVDDLGTHARLQLDLAMQMITPRSTTAWESPAMIRPIDEGDVIEELLASLTLDDHSALVLVGEDPSIQWVVSNEASGDINSEDSVDDRVTVKHAGGSHGPDVQGPRTLGQQMLSTPGTGSVAPGQRYVAPKKVLIVLVPAPREHYRLLGPTGYQPSNLSQSSKAQTP